MKIETSRFGTLEIEREELIEFPQGMIGFADQREYLLIDHAPGSPVHWLQSTQVPGLAFPLVDPDRFVDGYLVHPPAEMNELLGSCEPADLWLGVVMSLPVSGRPTLNLKAPVVMNSCTRRGVQLVLDQDLPVRLPIGRQK
ncbi:MAG: hypothetical protein DRI34_01615 [Deltaproteobacteria bacterium]|nr:MAG: hypothetical protein DRI34_01615 [Deltaproteobacteria bacterium]